MGRVYVLTERGYKILKAKGINLTCKRCGNPIMPGDKVRCGRSGRHVSSYYHFECYQDTFHDFSSENDDLSETNNATVFSEETA